MQLTIEEFEKLKAMYKDGKETIVRDTITISYTKPNEVMPTTKTFTSNNYKYWYEHTCDKAPIRNVEIKSANIKIDNVTYKNVDYVLVNGESVIDGIRDGHVEVEVEL